MLRILLLEDDETQSELLCIALKNANYAVTHCETGTQARALLREASFDLVIVDLFIRKGRGPAHESGLAIIEHLRKARWLHGQSGIGRAPIIAISGFANFTGRAPVVDLALRTGADRGLAKPFDLKDLFALIEELTDPAWAAMEFGLPSRLG